MSKELERKFILTKDQATKFMERRLVFGVFKIFQGYFNLDDPNNEFRIRLSYPDTYHPKFSSFLQAQELQDPSQHSYYDSGLEESETPSSKSSSGPRLGPLALPEDHYERTTPDGSIGEMEHPENGEGRWHGRAPQE